MSTLTFENKELKELLANAEQRWPVLLRQGPFEKGPAKPCFWLVGDRGVYLMHNGAYDKENKIVYAKECNPLIMDTDEWWDVKADTFGGDDGVIDIDAETIRNAVKSGSDLTATFKDDSVELTWFATRNLL